MLGKPELINFLNVFDMTVGILCMLTVFLCFIAAVWTFDKWKPVLINQFKNEFVPELKDVALFVAVGLGWVGHPDKTNKKR